MRIRPIAGLVCLLLAGPAFPLGAQLTTSGSLRLRYEGWSWFEPGSKAPVAPGSNSYGYGAAVLKAGLRYDNHRWFEATAEFQNTALLGLPQRASGPPPVGELGLGASYYTPHQKSNDTRLFLDQGFVTLKRPKLGALRAGRFSYIDGSEAVTHDPTLEWLRRNRVAGRLIGTFGFSHGQRSFDGASVEFDRPRANVTLFAAHPRQGGFELNGWREISEVDIAAATLTLKPALLGGKSEARLFAMYYADRRNSSDSIFKADNRLPALRTADGDPIHMPMLGGHLIHHGVLGGSAQWDGTVWGVYQGGSWGRLDHRAWAMAAEAGLQIPGTRWAPWLRAGYNRSSGDDDPGDGTHATFFQALTTVRSTAQFPFFNLMNNEDLFAQLLLRPAAGRVTLRADVHRLRLAEANDLWYGGSGAFQRRGSFGFGGRPSGGHRDLATLADLSVDCTVRPWWNVYAYVGHAFGGRVVRASYAADAATFAYLEMTLHRH